MTRRLAGTVAISMHGPLAGRRWQRLHPPRSGRVREFPMLIVSAGLHRSTHPSPDVPGPVSRRGGVRRCDGAWIAGLAWWLASNALAQVCPSPVVVVGSACTVTPGTLVTVTPANAIGLNASGSAGQITGNGITANLAAATTTGALAQSGSTIFFNGSTLKTTATTTATSAGHIGFRATGTGSAINATGSTITMGPPGGTVAASSMRGATADSGGILTLANTPIQMLGRTSGVANYGVVATGVDSRASISGGSVTTMSLGSFGVLAQSGGHVS